MPEANKNLTQKAVAGASWSTLSVVGGQVVSLFVTIYLANKIIPGAFGIFAMVAVVVKLLNVLKDLGLNMAVVQKKVLTDEDISTVFWSNMLISFVMGAMLFLSAGFIAGFYEQEKLVPVCRVLAIPFFLNGIGATHLALANRSLKFRNIAIVQFLAILISGLAAVLYVHYETTVWVLVSKNIINAVVFNFLILFVLRIRIRLLFSTSSLKELLSFSLFYSATRFYSSFATKSDEVFLGKFADESALGIYSNAYKIILLPLTLLKGQVVRVLFPMLSGIQENKARVKLAVLKISALLAFLGFACIFGLIMVSEELVSVLLGEEWTGMAQLIRYLGVFFLFEVSTFPGAILLSQGKSSEYFWLMTATKTLTMTLMGLGAYYSGVIGLLEGMIVAGTLSFLPYLYMSGKYIGVTITELLSVKVYPFLLSLGCYWIVRETFDQVFNLNNDLIVLILKIILFTVSYLICSYLLGVQGGKELRSILIKK
jgi:PST family polysaccharide transporter